MARFLILVLFVLMVCGAIISYETISKPSDTRQPAVPNLIPESAAPQPELSWKENVPYLYLCGEQPVTVHLKKEAILLTLNGKDVKLTRVPSGSGIKYEATDNISFWSKGNTALLTVNDEALPECRFASTADHSFHAKGNEPGWLLEISEEQVSLLADYGKTALKFPRPQMMLGKHFKRYEVDVQNRHIMITVFDTPCTDNMSGSRYPNTVLVSLGAKELRGCGEPGLSAAKDEATD